MSAVNNTAAMQLNEKNRPDANESAAPPAFDLLITRVFNTPRELVYAVWTNPTCAIK
jgi:hypothetical protein